MLRLRICGKLALRNAKVSLASDASRRISNQVGSLILLKETLELLPGLGQPLQDAESELLHAVGSNCGHEVFQTLLDSVTEVLDEVNFAVHPEVFQTLPDSVTLKCWKR